jgi:hypothetical protein
MKRIISCLIATVLTVSSTSILAQSPVSATDSSGRIATSNQYWMTYAERLPIGSTVRVRTTDGKRLTAVLAIVDRSGITLAPKTRIPEAPRHIPYEKLDQLELKEQNRSLGKSIAIGSAVGVGAFFGIVAILAAAYN